MARKIQESNMCNMEGWEYLDEKKTEWILGEAEKYLQATYSASCDIDKKSFSLLAATLTLLSAIVGYIRLHADSSPLWLYVAGVFVGISFVITLFQIKTSNCYSLGTRPSLSMKRPYIEGDLHTMKQGALTAIEQKIKQNMEWNSKRCCFIDWAVWTLVAALAVSIGSAFFTHSFL